MKVIAFTNEQGLREYRLAPVVGPPAPRWPWLVLMAFLLGLALGAQLHAAEPCVTLRVRPAFMLRPGDVDVQARVAHHADHRTLRVAWDSDVAGAGARQMPLEGDTDRVLFQWWNKDQPAAHYVFDAVVFDASGKAVGRDRAEIRTPEREP